MKTIERLEEAPNSYKAFILYLPLDVTVSIHSEYVRWQDFWDACPRRQAQRGGGGPEEEAAVVCWEPGASGQRCWQTEGCYSWDTTTQRAGEAPLSHSVYTVIWFTFSRVHLILSPSHHSISENTLIGHITITFTFIWNEIFFYDKPTMPS